MQARIIFITGTDTGVGKTVLTGLLLSHLRQSGVAALALKPFCSGGRKDSQSLQALQDGDLSLRQVTPFYFREPLAPMIAARLDRRRISMEAVLSHVRQVAEVFANSPGKQTPVLLIEGAGGILAPLGKGSSKRTNSGACYSAVDLIRRLECEVILVAANRLGTINHTLLTFKALRAAGVSRIRIVLMKTVSAPHSTPDMRYNKETIAELVTPEPVLSLGYLGKNADKPNVLKRSAKTLRSTLQRLLEVS